MATTKIIVDTWLQGIEKDLIKNYKRLGLKASGDWEKSVESKSSESRGTVKASILANDYTQYMENGRRPNKDQSEDAIRRWVGWAGNTIIKDWLKDKGLQNKLNPFAVAYKIATEGIKVPNKYNKGGLVSDVITDEKLKELGDSLTLSYVESFRSEIIKGLKV
jgi:hypothetical protein